MHLYFPLIPDFIMRNVIQCTSVCFASEILGYCFVNCHTDYVGSSISRNTIDDNIITYCYTSALGFKKNP